MDRPSMRWRWFQLADSAFPTGGFAHSCGLEAAVALGRAQTPALLEAFVREMLCSLGMSHLPFVAEACNVPNSVWALDQELDAFLSSHVANRASRTQGRAFVATCARVFDLSAISDVAARARTREVACHMPPVFGACLAHLGFSGGEASSLYLYLTLRGMASAGVRLGILGPHEAQRLIDRQASTLDRILEIADANSTHAASTAPVLDIIASTHDRLYARLFQS